MKYVLDANVLIEAHRRYYSFDLAPNFWRVLQKLAKEGHIITIDKIKDELTVRGGEDNLHTWIDGDFCDWCESTDDQNVFKSYREIITWAYEQQLYMDAARAEFAQAGDSWLIAYAKAYGHTVVTLEQYKAEAKKRILIPNVCRAFNIPYIDTFSMLRTLRAII